MDENLEFYKNKKVLITGHTGFKGSWLTLILHQIGAEVCGIALDPKTPDDFFVVSRMGSVCDSHIFDINDFGKVRDVISDFQPDLLFHLAAQPLVRYSYHNPLETYQTNVIGTANVLEALRYVKSKCAAVIITTDKVYENREWQHPYRESDQLGGKDPYSSSKACAELVVASYRNSFFHPEKISDHKKAVATARAGNVIGGGDWAEDRLIPDIVRAIRNNSEIIIRNAPDIRPWQHVLDPIYGYLILGQKLYEEPVRFSDGWNFGPYPEKMSTVEAIVKKAINIFGKGSYRVEKEKDAPHEATLLKLDISKALSILGWEPVLNTNEAVEWTINWYKQLITNKDQVEEYSINQLHEYLKLVK